MPEIQYIFGAVTTGIGLLISVVAFFLKRTIDKMDKRMKDQEDRTRELEEKLNNTVSQLPFLYVTREDFIRSTSSFERKLDKIHDMIATGLANGGIKND